MQKQTADPIGYIALACAITAWWLARPYIGIELDALYYAVDALRRTNAPELNQDLFFGPGTQGEYSIFPVLFGQLTQQVGLEPAALWLTATSHLIWPICLGYLSYAALENSRWPLGAALVLLLPVYYDSHHRLSYGETFATPRPWAEAIAMLALATAAQKRHSLSLVLAILACVVHPLMGISALLVVILMLPRRWAVSLLTLAATAIAILTAYGVGPATGLMKTYDPQWFEIVAKRNPMVLFAEWRLDAISRAAMSIIVLIGVSIYDKPGTAAQRLAWSLAWMTMSFLSAWVVGTLFENVLITQIQLYRAIWLAQLAGLVLVVKMIPEQSHNWRLSDIACVALLGSALIVVDWTCLPLAMAALAVKKWPLETEGSRSKRLAKMAAAAAVTILAALFILHILSIESQVVSNRETHQDRDPLIRALASEPAIISLAAVLTAFVWTRLPILIRPWIVVLCLCGPIPAALYWTSRALDKTSESHYRELTEWAKRLPDSQGAIFWDAGVANAWLGLGRPFYASTAQGAQMLFSRTLAVELDRRLNALGQAGFSNGISHSGEFQRPKHLAHATPDVRAICRDKKLSLVLLDQTIDRIPSQTLALSSRNITVYDCAALR